MNERKIYEGKVLRAIRELRNLTCPDIARQYDISLPVIYDYEQGRSFPRAKNAKAIEAALRIDLEIFKKYIYNSEIETGVATGGFKVNPDGTTTSISGTSGVQKTRIDPADLAQQIIDESRRQEQENRKNAASPQPAVPAGADLDLIIAEVMASDLDAESKVKVFNIISRHKKK